MTDQSSGTGPDVPVMGLQSLNFQPISNGGDLASYEALFPAGQAPASPVFSVTVTLASSILSQAEQEVTDLLSGMKAAFVVLPELPPDSGGSRSEEAFDVNKQLLIEIGLASYEGTGPVGVAVTVETVTGVVPLPIGSGPTGNAPAGNAPACGTVVKKALEHTIGAGLDDYWRAKPNQSFTAKVDILIGEGTVRPPKQAVYAVNTYYPTGKQVIVHAGQHSMNYSLNGNFVLGPHGVRGN